MNRPTSRAQLWRRAARAFAARNRQALSLEVVRDPEPNETPLSRAEVAYGVREGLIAPTPVHTERTAP